MPAELEATTDADSAGVFMLEVDIVVEMDCSEGTCNNSLSLLAPTPLPCFVLLALSVFSSEQFDGIGNEWEVTIDGAEIDWSGGSGGGEEGEETITLTFWRGTALEFAKGFRGGNGGGTGEVGEVGKSTA